MGMMSASSKTVSFADKIEALARELPDADLGQQERRRCIVRLRGIMQWLKDQEPDDCPGCKERGRMMQVRRRRAKVCHNCEFRDSKTKKCGKGGDSRAHIVDGTCPEKKFKE